MAGLGGKVTNQADALRNMLAHIAEIKTAPDADLPFLIALETAVLGKLKQPIPDILASAYGPGAGQPPGVPGQPPGPVMQPAPGGMGVSPPPGMGVNGVQSMASLPPVDEIRRMLAGRQK